MFAGRKVKVNPGTAHLKQGEVGIDFDFEIFTWSGFNLGVKLQIPPS